MIIKAKSPAGFAEKYIIASIWNGRFPPGSILPAERELSELIGVTRTTLREVLQRLARDGWLTIQHGKPTKVNQFMETSGLHILDTLLTLDTENVTKIVEDLLAARTAISPIFMRHAFKANKAEAKALLESLIYDCQLLEQSCSWTEFVEAARFGHQVQLLKEEEEKDPHALFARLSAKSFNLFDYHLFQQMAFLSGNLIYGLIFNGVKKLYDRVGSYYFSNLEARKLALNFYQNLYQVFDQDDPTPLFMIIRSYGQESALIWNQMKTNLPSDFTQNDM